jgi:hypothetical protein
MTAAATEYTGPLSLTQPTAIFARTRHPNAPSDPPALSSSGVGAVPNGSRWSAPFVQYVFPGAVAASQSSIQISEVLYHPNPATPEEIALGYLDGNDFEFIRLTNTGAVPVDLTGISFSAGVEFTAPAGLQNWLPAGASVVVVENVQAFTQRYGNAFTVLGKYNGELSNSGEQIILRDKSGAIISSFLYGDLEPWPVKADQGSSLIFLSGDQTVGENWKASLDPGGTAANSYSRWLTRYYTTSQVSGQPMTQDDDHDGLNNLGEYAFATDPKLPGSLEQSRGVLVPSNPPSMAVRRRKGATDISWHFETSSDLENAGWTMQIAPPASTTDNLDGTETVIWQAPAPAAGTRLFMRVQVTSP